MKRLDIVKWLNDLCIFEVTLATSCIEDGANYPVKNDNRRQSGFVYTVEGTEIYRYRDKTIRVEPGSVLYMPKGEKYTIELEKGEKNVAIVIDCEVMSENIGRPFCVNMHKASDIKSLFLECEKTWMRNKPDSKAQCKSIFYKIVSSVIKQEVYYSSTQNYKKISPAVDYLHAHYLEEDFRIDTLFAIADVSPRYFETLFFNEFKMTPKEYVTSLKIKLAKQLLKSEKYSVGDIAMQLGYCDAYHFSKMFKSKTGYTPREYKGLEI